MAATGFEKTLTRIGDEVDDIFLVETKAAERFGDEDVAAFGKANLFGVFADEGDAIAKVVGIDQRGGSLSDGADFDGVDVASARFEREKRKQASARAEIDDHVTGFDGAVNGFAVGVAANLVEDELLVRPRSAVEERALLEDFAVEPESRVRERREFFRGARHVEDPGRKRVAGASLV